MELSKYVSAQRIRRDLETIAQYTNGVGPGTTRLTFSKEEMQARAYFRAQMEQTGLDVYFDPAGNVVGRLEGTNPELPIIMIASHIDSILNGGDFDGVTGVVAGLEVVRAMKEMGFRPKRTIEVVGLTGEENSRFFPGVVGSRSMIGDITVKEINSTKGSDGVMMNDAMLECGFVPEEITKAIRPTGSIYMYLELHVEQCKVLEMTRTTVGVVTCVCAAAHQHITINGTADHAGGTPMNMRSDAMMAAAEVALEAERIAKEIGHDTVATFGKLVVHPNVPNVIPNCVEVLADIRSSDIKYNIQVMDGVEKKLNEVCARRGCSYTSEKITHGDATIVPDAMIQLFMDKADELGVSNRRIYSGAGHDSVVMNAITPVSMLFVPSKDGLSHCPQEWTDYEDIQKGATVLLAGVMELANTESDRYIH